MIRTLSLTICATLKASTIIGPQQMKVMSGLLEPDTLADFEFAAGRHAELIVFRINQRRWVCGKCESDRPFVQHDLFKKQV